MRLSGKQKRALEKISGKAWDSWHPAAVKSYFAVTDKGQYLNVPSEAEADFNRLMECHHWHTVDVEQWKEDFRKGLLFPEDFLNGDHSPTFVRHALQIYAAVMSLIPAKYKGLFKQFGVPAGRLLE